MADWREQAKVAIEEALGHGYSSLDNLLNALVDAAAPAIRADERERIAQLLDQLAERDRRIRAQADQINELKAMLAMTARTP